MVPISYVLLLTDLDTEVVVPLHGVPHLPLRPHHARGTLAPESPSAGD